jgi:peptide subunit release factor 1 (eRF1)
MIRQEDLQELLAFDAAGSQVVSLYLNADTTQQTSEIIKKQARALLKEADVNAKDMELIGTFLDLTHDWAKPGLAIFSCAQLDFFRAFPSAVTYRNRARLSHKPHVKPLSHLLDHYAHYGVVLVDRIGARFFEYHLGELRDSAGTMGEDIRKLKTGGGSSRGGGASSSTGQRGGQGARRDDEALYRNLRDTAGAARQFFTNKPIRRLFIGGTTENVAQFREFLPKQLQGCIAGTFPLDMTAGEHEVRKLSLELLHETNVKRETELVKTMITTAAKGGNATLGLAPTLKSVSEGRVQILVISDDFRSPGYLHLSTNYLSVYAEVPVSGSEDEDLVKVQDVVEAAASRTMEQGGSVEIITGNQELEDAGRIGAVLRY